MRIKATATWVHLAKAELHELHLVFRFYHL